MRILERVSKQNGVKRMKDGREAKVNMDEWAFIPMIPFGLLAGYWGTMEVRITGLAEEGFRIRLAHPASEAQKQEVLELAFYDYDTASYHRLIIHDACLVMEKQEPFFTVCTFATKLEAYRREVQRLAMQYGRYIRWKMEGDDALLAEQMTGYPAEEDEQHFESLEEQKQMWFASIQADTFLQILRGAGEGNPSAEPELALEMDRPVWYKKYLEQDAHAFFELYFRKNQITKVPEFQPNRLYFGNAFCSNLFPDEDTLLKLVEKACREQFSVTLVFPVMWESKRRGTEHLLKILDIWCRQRRKKLEIVANDWGTAALAAEWKSFTVCLGILLNKRKKDPRIEYKQGNGALFCQNNLNAAFYRKYLKETCGIKQYEWETCGCPQEFPEGSNSLYFPFYQTNTSQHCTLYAECVNENRGAQKQVEECPHYCEQQVFLYPKHLQMIGRYNSLFALDLTLIQKPAEMGRAYAAHGIKRFILNLL